MSTLIPEIKLNNSNYHAWKTHLSFIFRFKHILDVATNPSSVPAASASQDEKDAWNSKNEEALGLIGISLNPDLYVLISHCTSAHEAWDALKQTYDRPTESRKIQLQDSLEDLRYNDFKSMDEFLLKFDSIKSQLIGLGVPLTDIRLITIILKKCLPKPFQQFITNVHSQLAIPTLSNQLTYSIFQNLLRQEEAKLLQFGTLRTNEHAYVSKNSNKNFIQNQNQNFNHNPNQNINNRFNNNNYNHNNNNRCNSNNNNNQNSNHNNNNNRFNSSPNQYNKRPHCTYCGKDGHLTNTCFKKQKDKQPIANNQQIHKTQSRHAFTTIYNAPKRLEWIVDSGASQHVTSHKEVFDSLQPDPSNIPIQLADNHTCKVEGFGEVSVPNGKLHDVLYVPDLKSNLLSIPKLCQDYKVEFHKDMCSIIDPSTNEVIANAKMDHDNLFKFYEFTASRYSLQANVDFNKWHERLGHLNSDYISLMIKSHMVEGLPHIVPSKITCTGCMSGKMHRDPFPHDSSWRASHKLQLIHSDLLGPMDNVSIQGSKYALTLIDDFTRRIWIYFLQSKDQVLDTFAEFHMFVERQSDYKIKTLRTDNGTEYVNNAFHSYLRSFGIKHQLTVPYTPQQNGVAERKNRTIVEMARCMLHAKNMHYKFWAEAMACATYILNRTPTKALKDITPEEAWSGRKPNLQHLRIFGSIAYVHIPKQKRHKLDAKSSPFVFVGYDENTKGYRVYNPLTNKVQIARDVCFAENEVHDCSNTQDEELTGSKIVVVEDQPPSLNPTPSLNTTPQVTTLIPPIPSNDGNDNNFDTNDAFIDHDSSSSDESITTKRNPKWFQNLLNERDEYITRFGGLKPRRINYCNYGLMSSLMNSNDPETFEQAKTQPHWQKAMQEEYDTLISNQTWELTPLPHGKNLVSCKWLYKTKLNANNEISKFKARLVARGFSQIEGLDYNETFAPVAKMPTIKIVLALASKMNWPIHQMDVKSAFLNGDLHEEIYMAQPPGFIKEGSEHLVCKLKKSIYGLKQSPREWYSKINAFFISQGFDRSQNDPNLYIKHIQDDIVIIILYVDDLILTSSSNALISDIKFQLNQKFQMTDLGILHYFLGMQIWQTPKGIFLSQTKYAQDLLDKFQMNDANHVSIPCELGTKLMVDTNTPFIDATSYRQLVGSLNYLTLTRPDIAYSVGLVSRFMSKPQQTHLKVARRILRYIKGTLNLGLFYDANSNFTLQGFTDSDLGGDPNDGKSTCGYCFFVGSGAISWKSKKDTSVSLCSTEAEYKSCTNASKEALWLRRILEDLGLPQQEPTPLYCDNQSAIALAKNPIYHAKSKHISLHHHFIREHIQEKQVSLIYCKGEDQVADILTKPLSREKFEFHCKNLGLIPFDVISPSKD